MSLFGSRGVSREGMRMGEEQCSSSKMGLPIMANSRRDCITTRLVSCRVTTMFMRVVSRVVARKDQAA
jgi:hypothetical protein